MAMMLTMRGRCPMSNAEEAERISLDTPCAFGCRGTPLFVPAQYQV